MFENHIHTHINLNTVYKLLFCDFVCLNTVICDTCLCVCLLSMALAGLIPCWKVSDPVLSDPSV